LIGVQEGILLFVVGIIDYNFLCFREAIQQVFELRNKNPVLVALSTNHHSNIINSQNATVNSETPNTTLNSAAVQS
jgi:Ras-related GTP-binding protein C/D